MPKVLSRRVRLGGVKPGATLAVFLEVKVVEVEGHLPAGEVTNVVTVSGGGAPPVFSGEPLTLANAIDGPPAVFGISAFGFAARDANGLLDTQAGRSPIHGDEHGELQYRSGTPPPAGACPVPFR